MGILITENTKAFVQGITGNQGKFHTKLMLNYGTKIVAGVTPGKGGAFVHGIPVYNTMKEAVRKHEATASVLFVPARFALDAAVEAIEAGLETLVIITEGIPIKDTIQLLAKAKRCNVTVVGPNTPGVITPSKCKLGIMPAHVFRRGVVGVISRSGTLTFEIAAELTSMGLGQSTCVGLGGDAVVGLSFVEALKMFKADKTTKAIALIGEIGGNMEELAAEYLLNDDYQKPVIAFVAGKSAPPGKRMGHAGAIIDGVMGTAESKIEAFRKAGVLTAEKPSDVARVLRNVLNQHT